MEIAIKAVCAMVGIIILMSLAIQAEIDGVFFMASIAILSGLGGYPVLQYLDTNLVGPAIKKVAEKIID